MAAAVGGGSGRGDGVDLFLIRPLVAVGKATMSRETTSGRTDRERHGRRSCIRRGLCLAFKHNYGIVPYIKFMCGTIGVTRNMRVEHATVRPPVYCIAATS